MKKISQKKKKEVQNLKNLLNQDVYIGIVDLTNLPSAQLQTIRKKLKDQLTIRTAKKSLIKLAIEDLKESKKGIEKLEEYLSETIPALLFTKEDPFKIAKLITKNKSKLSARPGQISPKDINIAAGPTKFSPGPIIGELGAAGIKAAIEGGKIVIKQDVHLVKKGDIISQKQADLLAKFDIQPMEIGLNLIVVYENGNLIHKDVLFISETEYIEMIKTAAGEAINLAVYIAHPTNETINIILQKAEREKIALEKKLDIKPQEEPQKEESQEPEPIKEEQETENAKPEEPQKEEKIEDTPKEPQKQQTKELKNQLEYTDESAKNAQEIINKMKDNTNGG